MARIGLILCFLCFSHFLSGQGQPYLFSDAIRVNISKFKIESNQAFSKGDHERGVFLFDSLVQNQLIGSRFNDFSFKRYKKKKFKLSKVDKPVVIITYASWCVPAKGEIPALNKLAREYSRDMIFVVVFWDKRQQMKKVSRKFNSHVKVCYAHESYRSDYPMLESMKHTLGFPVTYLLDENREVVSIKRGSGVQIPLRTPSRKAMEENYAVMKEHIATLLVASGRQKTMLARQ